MSELRQNLVTKEWYVIATERAKRPDDFRKRPPRPEAPPFEPNCPFCQGNEAKTPPTAFEIPGKDGRWQVRVVANKFSAVSPAADTERRIDGLYRSMGGFGIHEVIIECPQHNIRSWELPLDEFAQIFLACRHRYLAAAEDPRVELVIPFKNYGEGAGCSLMHPHSQIIGVGVVPTHIRYRTEEARRHYDETGKCAVCSMIEEELRESERVIIDEKNFLVFAPYACGMPFETWITPKRHIPSFGDTSEEEVRSLAAVMKGLLLKVRHGLDDPDFNYVIRSSPTDERTAQCFHWYIKLMPRLAKAAGFELGTGMYVNVTLPEQNAAFLRDFKV